LLQEKALIFAQKNVWLDPGFFEEREVMIEVLPLLKQHS
jgi:hypothetical protein